MALANQITPDHARRQLGAWLSAREGVSDVEISEVSIPSANGLSNETLLFDASWSSGGERHDRGLVARVAPASAGLTQTYDIAQEHRVLTALAGTDVPVPELLFHEEDPAWLNAPFLIMERLPGRVATDDPPYTIGGWVAELSSDDRRTFSENGIRALASVARVGWEALGLHGLRREEPGETPLDRELAHFARWLDWAREGEENPVIDAAFAWVRANRPSGPEPVVLSWGDARVGNVLFAGDLSVSAVLDWEFATLASPELDLGWWLFMQGHFTEALGVPLPPGLHDRAETIALFEEHSGHSAPNIDFYEVFGGLRFCVMMVRAAALVKAAGAVPPDSTMATNNPGTQLLARMLDLPAPEGAASHVIDTESHAPRVGS